MATSKSSETVELPDSLSSRVQFFRNQLNITPNGLAQKAQIPLSTIEDIESGLQTFLAPSMRQKLARALRVKNHLLKDVERIPEQASDLPSKRPGKQSIPRQHHLLEKIIQNPYQSFDCPECSSALNIQFFERRDIEDVPVTAIKVNCTSCLFRVSTQ